jgi:hypothetical protein
MTSRTLRRFYPSLDRDERFRLLMAAWGRGDDREVRRLGHVAPVRHMLERDTAPRMTGLKNLALITYCDLQDHAGVCGLALSLGDSQSVQAKGAEEVCRIDATAMRHGHALLCKWLAWEQFCEEWHVRPTLFWDHLAGFGRMKAMRSVMEDFRDLLHRIAEEQAQANGAKPVTPESALIELQNLYEFLRRELES